MESVVNAWGGEGVLTATVVFLMGMLGMFRGTVESGEHIHVRILDLESPDDTPELTDYKRACEFADLYTESYRKLYGSDPEIVYDKITIYDIADLRNGTSVAMKFGMHPLLSLGCTREDIDLEISKGIYGKPWLGEVFYSGKGDTSFSKLYKDISAEELIAINCGGYRGGGTAATFVPMENAYRPSDHRLNRYMVVSGPSTRFKLNLKLKDEKSAEIYSGIEGLECLKSGYDIFDIPAIKRKLLTFSPTFDKFEIHQQNLRLLDRQWQAVVNDEKNLENLDPNYYAPRFLDRLYTDISQVSATFLSLKTDGKKLLDYDVTSDTYQPKIQKHKMHISNLINGVSVREIIAHHENYKDHGVYSFGYGGIESDYSPDTLFDDSAAGAFSAFMIMAVILGYYVHDALALHDVPFGDAQQKNVFMRFITGAAKEMNADEINVCKLALGATEAFIGKYVMKCIYMIDEINTVSDMTEMFPDSFGECMSKLTEDLYSHKNVRCSGADKLEFTANRIMEILRPQSRISSATANIDHVRSCLTNMRSSLPSVSKYIGSAEKYGDELVRFSMKTAQEIMHIK